MIFETCFSACKVFFGISQDETIVEEEDSLAKVFSSVSHDAELYDIKMWSFCVCTTRTAYYYVPCILFLALPAFSYDNMRFFCISP